MIVTQVTSSSSSAVEGDDPFLADARLALAEANLPSLLAAMVHLTGDRSLLEGRFRPRDMRGPGDHDSAGLDPELQDEVRALALEILVGVASGKTPALQPLTADEVLEILSLSLDEEVPSAQAGMLAEELGAVSRATPVFDETARERIPSVLVVGAGFSGLCAAIRLKEAGVPYTMIERRPDLGGTWYDNTYPGCGVDTPIHLYSFSFAQRSDWPRYFAKQGDVSDYLTKVAADLDISPRIRFGTELVEAAWDEAAQVWNVRLEGPEGPRAEQYPIVISAVGLFNQPSTPEIDGLEGFAGPVAHTAAWDPSIELTGKRVAVIGTGASAMQFVPAIADRAQHVTIFQRSAQWIIPNPNTERLVPEGQKFLMDHFPGYLGWYRLRHAWNFGDRLHPMLRIDDTWEDQERSINADNERHRAFLTRYISRQLAARPELIDVCVPTYPPYGKRPLLDHGWFVSLVRDDVTLVPHGVTKVEGDTVVASDGTSYEADVIVLATGFRTLDVLGTMSVTGRDGESLRDAWGADDARAYLGMTVPHFPNFFILYGPNTNAGHGGSHVMSVEMQVRYVLQAIGQLVESEATSIEVRPDVFEAYNAELDVALEGSIWTHEGMTNYYRNSAGRIVTNIPWTNAEYWHRTRTLDPSDFVFGRGEGVRS